MKKLFINGILLFASALTVSAQSGTNSPYSQYGLGILSEQSQGFNRGMNGLGLGFRYGNQVNTLNPASYSAADSLTMIFDVGLSGQITNFKEGNTKVNAKNADFEYAVAMFRAMPSLGISFGIVPFTNVGYSYSRTDVASSSLYSIETHSGNGGLREVYVNGEAKDNTAAAALMRIFTESGFYDDKNFPATSERKRLSLGKYRAQHYQHHQPVCSQYPEPYLFNKRQYLQTRFWSAVPTGFR